MRPAVNNEVPTCSSCDAQQPTAEQVAEVVAGIPAIGAARAALQQAGWHATIAGNRITVNDYVLVHFIGAVGGAALVIDVRRRASARVSPIATSSRQI